MAVTTRTCVIAGLDTIENDKGTSQIVPSLLRGRPSFCLSVVIDSLGYLWFLGPWHYKPPWASWSNNNSFPWGNMLCFSSGFSDVFSHTICVWTALPHEERWLFGGTSCYKRSMFCLSNNPSHIMECEFQCWFAVKDSDLEELRVIWASSVIPKLKYDTNDRLLMFQV